MDIIVVAKEMSRGDEVRDRASLWEFMTVLHHRSLKKCEASIGASPLGILTFV